MALPPVPPKGLYVDKAGYAKIYAAWATREAGGSQYGVPSTGRRRSRLGDGCQRDHALGRVPCLGQPVSLQLPAIAPLAAARDAA